jgi:predicted small integral membrane protein
MRKVGEGVLGEEIIASHCMHIFNVFYYNYYCFYKKIIKDPDPHFATLLVLSFSEGLLINGPIDIFVIKWYCYQIPVGIHFSAVLILVLVNYLLFQKNGKGKKIIKVQPTLGNNLFLSRSYLGVLFYAFMAFLGAYLWKISFGKM